MMAVILRVALIMILTAEVSSHGYLADPPARNSAWRFGFKTPTNSNDMGLYCGGFRSQWVTNGGKCGICGDPYDGKRDHEAGGRFATGTIVRTYQAEDAISINVQLTAAHRGYFEFRICPNNDPKTPATQECLDKHVLQRADGKGVRTPVTNSGSQMLKMEYKLPAGMTCTQCVMQWKYHTGNSWGKDPATGESCTGCGPQEEFINCADVAIVPREGGPEPTNTPTQTTVPTAKSTTTVTPSSTTMPTSTATPTSKTTPTSTATPSSTTKPTSKPTSTSTASTTSTDPPSTTTTTTIASTTTATEKWTTTPKPTPMDKTVKTNPPTAIGVRTTRSPVVPPTAKPKGLLSCVYIGPQANSASMVYWCNSNCRAGFCPRNTCKCTTTAVPLATKPKGRFTCTYVGPPANSRGMVAWCDTNCNAGYCPRNTCRCTRQ